MESLEGAQTRLVAAQTRLAAAQADALEEANRQALFAHATRPPQGMTQAEVDRRFDYHRPSGEAMNLHADLRKQAKYFANSLLDNLPEGREKSLAMTAFEESTFWAHAAIARDPSLHEAELK